MFHCSLFIYLEAGDTCSNPIRTINARLTLNCESQTAEPTTSKPTIDPTNKPTADPTQEPTVHPTAFNTTYIGIF